MKKCVFILPFFGKFNNYFNLFLKTCGMNRKFDWLIFTDDKSKYNYPSNVKVIYTTFQDLKEKIQEKLDINISLPKPYKLCDYRPAFGYIFSDYICEYEYWGHCDCDLIFGNLDAFLVPLLDEGYDKVFAAGHLTIYKNNVENNMRFMKTYRGRVLYKKFLTVPRSCNFDEDWHLDNIHGIFLEAGTKVYCKSLAINPSNRHSLFVQREYDPVTRTYHDIKFGKAIYVWDKGNLYQILKGTFSEIVKKRNFLYMHFQEREMSMDPRVLDCDFFQIVPNKFILLKKIPENNYEFARTLSAPISAYLFAYRRIRKRIINKIKRVINK